MTGRCGHGTAETNQAKSQKFLFFIFLFIYFPFSTTAQNPANKDSTFVASKPGIKWISQFSSSRDFSVSNKISQRIFNFIFGAGDKNLVRPINLIVTQNDEWVVMDQGSKCLWYVSRKGTDFFNLNKEVYPSPIGICAAEGGHFFFTDSYLNKVYQGRISKKKIQLLTDSVIFLRPTGIAYCAKSETIWIVETQAHRITVLNKSGELLRRYGSRGTSPGEFNFPAFIWIDKNGLVYIVDSMNFRVQVMNQQGKIISIFGEAGDATGYFARPKGIATDSYGNIYVVDALFHTVQIFNKEGRFLSNFGEQGSEPGQFWLPVGIYIDDTDKIYVADSYNSRIQVFQLVFGGRSEN